MSNKEELRVRLRNEYAELDRRIGELQSVVDGSKGAIKLYREQRLHKALEDRERLNGRLRMVGKTQGDLRWVEAERLWSDLRNAVLGMASR